MRRKYLIPVFVLASLLILQFMLVDAATNDNLNWSIGCEGFTSVGGGLVMNRDNTGNGFESYTIRAVDGVGNVIFGPLNSASFVGSGVYVVPGTIFNWSINPIANPLTVTVTSDAGNRLPAQTVYTVTGRCEGIGTAPTPTPAPPVESVFEALFGGRSAEEILELLTVSPSVPLNANPPRPSNRGETLRGTGTNYVIVDRLTVNLRSGAGPQYTIVGRVDGGAELFVIGRNEERSWWFVEIDGVRGWVNNTLVLIVGDMTNIPVVPSEGEIFPPRLYVYRTQPVLLSPREGAPVVCEIAGDLEYVIIGQTRNGEWLALETECNGGPVVVWIPTASGAVRNSGDLLIPVIPG